MINYILATVLSLPLTYALYNAYCLLLNYRIARKIAVPMIVLPASPDNPVWQLTSGFVLSIVKAIFGDCSVTRFGRLGWEYYNKSQPHLELGDVFVLVTPAHNWVYVCNAETVNEIFQRRNDFPRPGEMMAMLDVFGPNIATANGADWQRQRKVTGTQFNEQNSSGIWREALKQAGEVLQFWKSVEGPIRRTDRDTRTLSLHVLSGAGFGKPYSFLKAAEPPRPGQTFNYRDSLALILENMLLILIFGPKFLSKKWLPKRLHRLGRATIDFKFHMTEMVNDEKQRIFQGKPGSQNIINSLIMASEEMSSSSKGAATDGLRYRGLTEDEVYGNIFLFNFAGHDTTSITLSWVLYLLAAQPEVQDWISEEINEVIGDDRTSFNYNDIYPRLNRCLAVLLETLRLWDPIIGIAKSTGSEPQTITVNGKPIVIPARSRVIPNINAIHSHPRYWGEDALTWKPSRWILSKTEELSSSEEGFNNERTAPGAREHLFTASKGSYVPWSEGARACPGKKFSQVEFVAILVALFRKHRVEVVPEDGETMQHARTRTLEVVRASEIVLLLQMKNPETVGLRWVEKDI